MKLILKSYFTKNFNFLQFISWRTAFVNFWDQIRHQHEKLSQNMFCFWTYVRLIWLEQTTNLARSQITLGRSSPYDIWTVVSHVVVSRAGSWVRGALGLLRWLNYVDSTVHFKAQFIIWNDWERNREYQLRSFKRHRADLRTTFAL